MAKPELNTTQKHPLSAGSKSVTHGPWKKIIVLGIFLLVSNDVTIKELSFPLNLNSNVSPLFYFYGRGHVAFPSVIKVKLSHEPGE